MVPLKKEVKIAPNSKESEMMVIGCMLTKPNSLNIASDLLDPLDFYYSEHQIIFHVLKDLCKNDKPADIHLVAEELKRREKLQEIGGVNYLTTLALYAGTAAYVEEYAELIKNKSTLRRMIQAAQEVEKEALEDPPHAYEALDQAQAKFFAISQQINPQAGIKIKDLLAGIKSDTGASYLKELQARQEVYLEKGGNGPTFSGVPSGFIDLDRKLNGLLPSNLIICAGRPAMGKTAFALNIAEKVCFQYNLSVGIFPIAISQQINPQAGIKIKDLLAGIKSDTGASYLKELQARQEVYLEKGGNGPTFSGVPSGFIDLDRKLNGLLPSNLIICAGRPAMGKTAFALNIAEKVCFQYNLSVGIFSLEMSAEQLLNRIICSQSKVESSKILTGSLSGLEYQRVVESANRMETHLMIIDDQPGLKITDLRARARRMKESHGIQLMIVDYLQLLSGSGRYQSNENRQQEISEISRMLKNLARELNIPIFCLCQLSRRVEERVGHRPMMSDLRESGAIEQDADVVIFLLRQDYYDEALPSGTAEVIIGKNRHGETGTIKVSYQKEFAHFDNYSSKTPTSDNGASRISFLF